MFEMVMTLHTLGKCSSKLRVLSHSSFFPDPEVNMYSEGPLEQAEELLNLCWGKYCLKTFYEFSLYVFRAEDKFSMWRISFLFSILVISPS